MTRLPFTAFAVTLLSVAVASAQELAPVQVDYDNYARLFHIKQEPNLNPIGNAAWRAQVRTNQWREFADGTEDREPMPAAQVLMGIYLIQHVDHRLSSHIETIVWDKFRISNSLAERVTLDQITTYLTRTTTPVHLAKKGDQMVLISVADEDVPNVGEFNGITLDKTALLVSDIRRIILSRSINWVPSRFARIEMRAIHNLFDPVESHRNWANTYRIMREKFDVLDALADSFPLEDHRQQAFQYVVGVYESSDFHLGSLRRILRYFRAAADAGDPLAQYHLALFLNYLGDFVDPLADPQERESEIQQLLTAAETHIRTRERMAEVKIHLAAEQEKAPGKSARITERVAALLKVENEKIDLLELAIIKAVQRIQEEERAAER